MGQECAKLRPRGSKLFDGPEPRMLMHFAERIFSEVGLREHFALEKNSPRLLPEC